MKKYHIFRLDLQHFYGTKSDYFFNDLKFEGKQTFTELFNWYLVWFSTDGKNFKNIHY